MILGISGKIASGKTEFAKVAYEHFGAAHISFASALKQEVDDYLHTYDIFHNNSALWGSQREKAEDNILIPTHYITQEMRNHGIYTYGTLEYSGLYHRISGRELLQFWSQWKREVNSNYWVHTLFADLDDNEFYVIDDVRHTNEADMIRVCDGHVIRVNRTTEYSNSTHIGETQLDSYPGFSVTINNTSSLEDYRLLCKDIIAYYYARYLDDQRRKI